MMSNNFDDSMWPIGPKEVSNHLCNFYCAEHCESCDRDICRDRDYFLRVGNRITGIFYFCERCMPSVIRDEKSESIFEFHNK